MPSPIALRWVSWFNNHLSAPNQVGIWIFSVKDYCFSKPLITGIVRFVQAKQRAKTPTRFRAGGSCRHFREFRLTFVQTAHIFRLYFVQFANHLDAALCRYQKIYDLISCSTAPTALRCSSRDGKTMKQIPMCIRAGHVLEIPIRYRAVSKLRLVFVQKSSSPPVRSSKSLQKKSDVISCRDSDKLRLDFVQTLKRIPTCFRAAR